MQKIEPAFARRYPRRFAFVKKHPIVHLKETVRDRVNFYLEYLEKAFAPLFIVGRAGKCAVREGA